MIFCFFLFLGSGRAQVKWIYFLFAYIWLCLLATDLWPECCSSGPCTVWCCCVYSASLVVLMSLILVCCEAFLMLILPVFATLTFTLNVCVWVGCEEIVVNTVKLHLCVCWCCLWSRGSTHSCKGNKVKKRSSFHASCCCFSIQSIHWCTALHCTDCLTF